MKTIICDIDQTITDMWPLEKAVLTTMLGEKNSARIQSLKEGRQSSLFDIYRSITKNPYAQKTFYQKYNKITAVLWKKQKLPRLEKFPLVKWITDRKKTYTFVYATGGQRTESLYALSTLGIIDCFDIEKSIDKTTYPFSKKTGIPFKRILNSYPDCIVVSDSDVDCHAARNCGIPAVKLTPRQEVDTGPRD